jgi:short-subunit dehydrogenase
MMAQGSGHIVNISSLAGALGVFGYTGYVASKFAVCGFSEALRVELKRHNIGVSLVLPFDTETPGLREERRTRPLEADVSLGAVRPERLGRRRQLVAYWLLKTLSGGGEPMTTDQVAEAILNGVRRERYLIVPDFTLKAAYYLRGLLIPLINWAWDQLLPLVRGQQARQRGEHPVTEAPRLMEQVKDHD